MDRITGFAFHCHHNKLVEWVSDYHQRVKYIKREKPPEEQALRLRLFKMIPPDRLPADLYKARADFAKAVADFAKVWADAARAWADVDWKSLHEELCPDCPWDGETIFRKD